MTDLPAISLTSVIRARPGVLSQEIDEATVVNDLDSGSYYGMEAISRRIWHLISEATVVSDLCATLTAEYDIAQPDCEAEVLNFLGELQAGSLILVDG